MLASPIVLGISYKKLYFLLTKTFVGGLFILQCSFMKDFFQVHHEACPYLSPIPSLHFCPILSNSH